MTRQDDHFEEFAHSDAFIETLMLGDDPSDGTDPLALSLIHISEPTRHFKRSRMPSSA